MSHENSGCGSTLGCLGSLVILTFIGSTFLGGGLLMRVGSFSFGFGNPANTNLSSYNNLEDVDKIITNYWNHLGIKAKASDVVVKQFHTGLNQGKCQEMYEQFAEIAKGVTKRSDWVRMCTDTKSKLGSVESTDSVDWLVRPPDQKGDYILIRYATKFSKSTAQEDFTLLVNGDKIQIAGYQVYPGQASSLPHSSSL